MSTAVQISRPVLRYHGGKWKLAPWLLTMFPEHRVYVEPFAGGASVLMRKQRSYAEVYNDRWDAAVNVFRVLRDPIKAQRLREMLKLTPYSRTEFMAVRFSDMAGLEDVEAARMTILRSFAGFGSASTNGDFATGFRANSNRSGTTPAHDWMNYPSHIERFTARLTGVIIENKDAIEVMRQHDGLKTLHYVDPPYPHSTRVMARGNASYAHEMSDDDHRKLASELKALRGMVFISGYACKLYDDDLFANWQRRERPTHGDGASKRTEVVWMNEAAAEKCKQKTLY